MQRAWSIKTAGEFIRPEFAALCFDLLTARQTFVGHFLGNTILCIL